MVEVEQAPTRERIVSAATHLFLTQGYAGTSTRDIASRVGIRQPSLYAHFSDKADLLYEVLLRLIQPSLDEAARLMGDSALSPVERLAGMVRHDVHRLCADELNVGLLAFLPEVRATDADRRLAEEQAALEHAYCDLVAAVLAESGRPVQDAARLTSVVTALVWGVILRRVRDPRLDPSATAAEVTVAALRVVGD